MLSAWLRCGKKMELACAGYLLATSACSGEGPQGSDPGPVARIEVSPGHATLPEGATTQLTASAFDTNGNPVHGSAPQWSSSAANVTVSQTGVVTAVSPGTATITAQIESVSGKAEVVVTPPTPTGQVVEVYSGLTYQTITGWEATAQIGQLECNPTAYSVYRTPLLDRAINELGINRVRLEIISGAENPVDWFGRLQSGQIDISTFRTHRYESVNDNSDPQAIAASGFQFSGLDHAVDNVVTPLRQRAAARGEQLQVNLTYVDFGAAPFEHSANPQEYAELMLAAFQHLQSKYGWVPDAVEIILEPDNTTNWRPATMGPAIVAAGDRLKAAGFRPAFIAPSNTNMTRALEYFDQMILMPRVAEYLTDLSYHRYGGVSDAVLQAIGARAASYGVRTGMLEHIGSGHEDLHRDLEIGRVSSWQQYTLAFCGTNDGGGTYYVINESTPTSPQIVIGSRTRFLRQYFWYVRQGAVRVGAGSGDGRLHPLAFRNPNGKLVVVVKADAAATFQVALLPAGTYGIRYTTGTAFDASHPDVTLTSGQSLSTSIPAAGVLTVFQR